MTRCISGHVLFRSLALCHTAFANDNGKRCYVVPDYPSGTSHFSCPGKWEVQESQESVAVTDHFTINTTAHYCTKQLLYRDDDTAPPGACERNSLDIGNETRLALMLSTCGIRIIVAQITLRF